MHAGLGRHANKTLAPISAGDVPITCARHGPSAARHERAHSVGTAHDEHAHSWRRTRTWLVINPYAVHAERMCISRRRHALPVGSAAHAAAHGQHMRRSS